MHRLFPIAALALCPLLTSQSNEILYYTFSPPTTNVVNRYAGGPRFGTMVSTAKVQYTTGKLDSAMQGATSATAYNYVDSGYKAAITGSFCVAWFIKQRTQLPNTLAYYFWSGEGNFRCFTSGAASNGLAVRGWGGSNLLLTTDIRTPAATRWVHVAINVDATNKFAQFYVDGQPQGKISISGGANVPARTNGFRVGAHTRLSTTSWWDIDEFRFLTRVATDVEIKTWSMALSDYGSGCGAKLTTIANQAPKLGNSSFGFELTGKPGSPALLSAGLSATKLFGSIPMPLDLGLVFPSLAGCKWESSLDLLGPTVIPNTGKAVLPFPLPNYPALLGIPLYNQALVLPATGSKQSSGGVLFTILH